MQVEEQNLFLRDSEELALFGDSVAVSGDTAVIGVPDEFPFDPDPASAYVFHYDGTAWVAEAMLVAGDGRRSFGRSVAISGDRLAVGAPLGSSSSVYLFRDDGSGWVGEAELRASDAAEGDLFGGAVAMSGDVVVVGTRIKRPSERDGGLVFVFRYDGSGWVEEAKLRPLGAPDEFGHAVAIDGDTVVVGSWPDDTKAGAAYLFHYDGTGWAEGARLIASDRADYDHFGRSVAIAGDTVVIGSPADDDRGLTSGSAYLFRFDGIRWVEEAKLLAYDGAEGDEFGHSIAVASDTVVVGAPDHVNGDDLGFGSAYVFRDDGTGWAEEGKLVALDGSDRDRFGRSVALSGNAAVIGAPRRIVASSRSGSANVFRLYEPGDCGVLSRSAPEGGVFNVFWSGTWGSFTYGRLDRTDAVLLGRWDATHERVAVRGDVNGLGKVFFNLNGNPFGERAYVFGLATEPVAVGDWNGDGMDTLVVQRRIGDAAKYAFDDGFGTAFESFELGTPSDTFLVGDWDGDGADGIGVVREVGGALQWNLKNALRPGAADAVFVFGRSGEVPLAGDWDGDGDHDAGLMREVRKGPRGLFPYVRFVLDFDEDGSVDETFDVGPIAATDSIRRTVVCDWDGDGADDVGLVFDRSGALGYSAFVGHVSSTMTVSPVPSDGDLAPVDVFFGNLEGLLAP